MAELVIDLNAKRIEKETQVWRLFPGAGYRFLSTFREAGLIYLDLPGIEFQEEPVTRQLPFFRERIYLAKANQEWLRKLRVSFETERGAILARKPTERLPEYTFLDTYPGYGSDAGSAVKLLGTIKKDDIVVVPGRGKSQSLLLGRVIDSPGEHVSFDGEASFLGLQTPARRVQWFPERDERLLDRRYYGFLRTQNALIEVPPELANSAFDLSYGSYYTEKLIATRLQSLADEFSGQATLDLGILTQLCAFAASEFRQGRFDEGSLAKFITSLVPDRDEVSYEISIRSPGFLNLKAETLAPLLLSAMFTIFMMADANAKPKPQDISIVNSANAQIDDCTSAINALVKDAVRVLGYDEWKSHCERTKRLATQPRLRVDSRGPRTRR